MAKKTLGSTKRFGTRYGRTIKEKVARLESQHRGKNKCPYCSAVQVRRQAAGIWECGKCKSKFTGKAYTYTTKSASTKPEAPVVKEFKERVKDEDSGKKWKVEKEKAAEEKELEELHTLRSE